jgi:membrane associated rhomboid family serine protease
MDKANTFSTIKSVSASIVFFHKKIYVFTNHPTMAPEVCMGTTTAAQKFALSTKRVKEPFPWFQLMDCAFVYGYQNEGFCHLVVATIAIHSFGAMCCFEL